MRGGRSACRLAVVPKMDGSITNATKHTVRVCNFGQSGDVVYSAEVAAENVKDCQDIV